MVRNELEFLNYKNIHKGKAGLVIGHGPSSETVLDKGHIIGPEGFQYGGHWEKFKGIRFSCHYKEYDSHYTVCAEDNGYLRETIFMQEGEIKFIGGMRVAMTLCPLDQFKLARRHTWVPFFPGWHYDNSGNLAWWIAYYMGCNPIYLAGIDYTSTDPKLQHFQNGYLKRMYNDIYLHMHDNGVEIFRVSEDCRLEIPIKQPFDNNGES